MENNLSGILNIASKNQYKIVQEPKTLETAYVRDAIHHQNILGWNSFLCGYISKLWHKLAKRPQTKKKTCWAEKLPIWPLILHKAIWEGCNTHVHVNDIKVAKQRAREAIMQRVKQLYQNPPRLATRYCSIHSVPLETCLRKSMAQLQDWLNKIKHQQRVSAILHSTLPPGQLTRQQAFARGNNNKHQHHKYPPYINKWN